MIDLELDFVEDAETLLEKRRRSVLVLVGP
jgi:hypothetical protein